MLVPKASVDENSFAGSEQCQIRPSRKRAGIEADIPQYAPGDRGCEALRSRALALNAAHERATS